MKYRGGFVSNSSSSSFIIGYKGNLDGKKLKKAIVEALKVPKDSPLYFIADEFANLFSGGTAYDREDWDDADAEKLIKKGFNVIIGSADDQGEPIEAMLCDIDLNYKSPDLVIIKDAGY